jgi:hypothetical protein
MPALKDDSCRHYKQVLRQIIEQFGDTKFTNNLMQFIYIHSGTIKIQKIGGVGKLSQKYNENTHIRNFLLLSMGDRVFFWGHKFFCLLAIFANGQSKIKNSPNGEKLLQL